MNEEQKNSVNNVDLSGVSDGSRVDFPDESGSRPHDMSSGQFDSSSKFSQLVIKYSGGMVKDNEQAQYVLLVIAILMIIMSWSFFSS